MKEKADMKGILLKFKLFSIAIVTGIAALVVLNLLYKFGFL